MLFKIDNDIKLEDNKNPIKPYLTSETFRITTTIYKEFWRELSEIRLNTDNSLILSSQEEIKSYKFTTERTELELKKEHPSFPGSFNQINFVLNTKTQIYSRSYRKIFEVISQIGGFTNGIVFIAYLLLYVYSQNVILWHCISTLISEEEIIQNISKLKKNNNRELIKSKIISEIKQVNEVSGNENLNLNNQSRNKIMEINNNLRGNIFNVRYYINKNIYLNKFRIIQENPRNNDDVRKIISTSNTKKRKENNSIKYFSFWNTICFKFCIINRMKRRFVRFANELVDNKLSLEYYLEISNNLEFLKRLTLNEEQYEEFDKIPHLKFEEQLKQFKINFENELNPNIS